MEEAAEAALYKVLQLLEAGAAGPSGAVKAEQWTRNAVSVQGGAIL